MSATPTTPPLWTGSFGKSGSPVLKVTVAGPLNPGQEFEAVLDTGFTGFLSMPLLQALPLGLVLYGTTTIVLADGSQGYRLTAKGQVTVGGESRIGVVILEPNSNEPLLGMAFLRQFVMVLYLSTAHVILVKEDEAKKWTAALLPTSANQPPPPKALRAGSDPKQN